MSRKSPNVLFVFADQLRRDALGFAGDPNILTPCLDRFAAESADCVNAISGVPVCCPARASLITGLQPHHHGVVINDVPLAERNENWGHRFSSAGYETAYIGKWHLDGRGRLAFVPPERRQGFKHWWANECSHDYLNSPYYTGTDTTLKRWEGYDAAAQTEQAIEFMRTCGRKKPFSLMLSWGPPHNPYHTAPERFRRQVDAATLQLRPNVPAGFPAEEARRELAGYYAHILALDELFGRLMDRLDELGLAEDTIVVFWSDHGDMLRSHGEQRKQRPWDESVRVPLLIRWRGNKAWPVRKLETLIDTPDLMPTLLGLCGVEFSPGTYDGRDLSRMLMQADPPVGDGVVLRSYQPFGEYARHLGGREYRGVRTGRYTYVRDRSGPWLLYDNAVDPYQMNNLRAKTESRALVGELDALLTRLLSESDDAFEPGDVYIKRFKHVVDFSGTAPVYLFPA